MNEAVKVPICIIIIFSVDVLRLRKWTSYPNIIDWNLYMRTSLSVRAWSSACHEMSKYLQWMPCYWTNNLVHPDLKSLEKATAHLSLSHGARSPLKGPATRNSPLSYSYKVFWQCVGSKPFFPYFLHVFYLGVFRFNHKKNWGQILHVVTFLKL